MADAIRYSLFLGVIVAWLCALIGCASGPPKAVRSALALSAEAILQVDAGARRRLAELEQKHCPGPMDACPPEALAPAPVVEKMEVARSALLSAEAAADAWENGSADKSTFFALVPCLANALASMVDAVKAAGWSPPKLAAEAVGALSSLAGSGQCEAGP